MNFFTRVDLGLNFAFQAPSSLSQRPTPVLTNVVFEVVDYLMERIDDHWEKAGLSPDPLRSEHGSKGQTLRLLPATWTSQHSPHYPCCLRHLHCSHQARCLEPVHDLDLYPFVLGFFLSCVLHGLVNENLCWAPLAIWRRRGQDVVAAAAAVVAAAADLQSQQLSKRHLCV